MADQEFNRKLAAILSADVKGYSRLMEEDESFTVRTLKSRRVLFSDNVRKHKGRVVNAPGDSILAEFPSVISAVQCAFVIQEQMRAKNADLPENSRMQFRIGINLGDVIESEDVIYGDGVNIASRIEALAEPDGVSISRTVFNHVHKKLKYGFEYQGEYKVKNIADPVRVYKLLSAPESAGKVIGEEKPNINKMRWVTFGALLLTILAAGSFAIWSLLSIPPKLERTSDKSLDKPEQTPFNVELTDDQSKTLAKTIDTAINDKSDARTNQNYELEHPQLTDESRKNAVLEITLLEKKLATIDKKIETMKTNLNSNVATENDGLMLALNLVEEREKQQKFLNESIKNLHRVIEHDITVYEKIAHSSKGEDLKEIAWKQLLANYPEASHLFTGDVDLLRLILFKKWIDPITKMEFVWVEGGCFQMGDKIGDGDKNERPVHEVCVDSFGMSKHEVTQGHWKAIMNNNPSKFAKGDEYPVEQVSWVDTQDFIRKLNSIAGKTFRLPTEAEWEYAACPGVTIEKYAGGRDIDQVAWYNGNSGSSTHPVGMKEPNALGLYDMSGNVWEWCSDRYHQNYYQRSLRNNPTGPSSGSFRVIRNGCWNGSAWLSRCTNRDGFKPGYRLDNLGFRVVLQARLSK
jgi:formylglycine-generating enzyme required for sulfatase activity/class 3 adenylate cyclase